MSPRLFPELDDIIIGFVSEVGNTESLRSCSLVCREWAFASRTYLYRNIVIDANAPRDRFCNLFQDFDGFDSNERARGVASKAWKVRIIYPSTRQNSVPPWFLRDFLPLLTVVEELRLDCGRLPVSDPIMDSVQDNLGSESWRNLRLVCLSVNIERMSHLRDCDLLETALKRVTEDGHVTSVQIHILATCDRFPVTAPTNVTQFRGTWTDTRTGTVSQI